MKRILVYCHPYGKSFNAAIRDVIVDAHKNGDTELKIYDLYDMGFDPVLSQKDLKEFSKAQTQEGINKENLDPVAIEMAHEINDSDELILLFPVWWELMPALMKGFIDKVIFPGLFYTQISKIKMKLISGRLKKVTVITTMNTPGIVYRILFGACIYFALIKGTFKKTGVKNCHWVNLSGVKFISQTARQKYLEKVKALFA